MKALILLIINFVVILKCENNTESSIKCYEGEGLGQRNWDKKDCEAAQWCIKLADDGNENEYRQCDEGNNICNQIGNKCDNNKPNIEIDHHPVTFPVDTICCCNSDYCNFALLQSYSTFIYILPVLLILIKYL